jgi:orotate phosphoribosyltransferase
MQVVRRKEAKDYGTKKLVEGVYEKGAKCVHTFLSIYVMHAHS